MFCSLFFFNNIKVWNESFTTQRQEKPWAPIQLTSIPLHFQDGIGRLSGCHGKGEGRSEGCLVLQIFFFSGSTCKLLKMVLCEQVWYHVCPNRGRGCYNTRLKEDGGCTIWYNEKEVKWEACRNSVMSNITSKLCYQGVLSLVKTIWFIFMQFLYIKSWMIRRFYFIFEAPKAQTHSFTAAIIMFYPPTCHKLWTLVVSPFYSFLSSQLLSDIEEHLKCTITQCEPDLKIPVDEFDGKVTYGQRRALGGTWPVTMEIQQDPQCKEHFE